MNHDSNKQTRCVIEVLHRYIFARFFLSLLSFFFSLSLSLTVSPVSNLNIKLLLCWCQINKMPQFERALAL